MRGGAQGEGWRIRGSVTALLLPKFDLGVYVGVPKPCIIVELVELAVHCPLVGLAAGEFGCVGYCRTVKHTWSELGTQLNRLAQVHAQKAKSYLNEVRKPLLDLTPMLEEARKEVRQREMHSVCIWNIISAHFNI